MKCLDCQCGLVKVPTVQGPDLDLCPSGHGLWLDVGEINVYVEDYLSLKRAVSSCVGVAVRKQMSCPRCGTHMESETVSGVDFLSCNVCHGWWLPRGSLTNLNATYRGGAVPIQIHETELYISAAARTRKRKQAFLDQPRPHKTGENNAWFWAVFLGLALTIGGLVFVAGIKKASQTAHWTHPPDALLLYLASGLAGGIGLLGYGWTVLQRKRLIESIPTSSIRSLALGLVEISGRAQSEEDVLTSPFGGLPCVFYSYVVEERVGSGNNNHWERIASGTSEQPFFVSDETGRVLVVPFGANLILPDERTSRNNWFGELPSSTMAGLHRLGISTDHWMGSKTLRCREAFILPEERVYVLGTALEHQGMSEQVENSSRLYIGSSRDHAFIISDRSEKDLLSRLHWQMWASFIGGLALTATCVITLVTRYLITIAS